MSPEAGADPSAVGEGQKGGTQNAQVENTQGDSKTFQDYREGEAAPAQAGDKSPSSEEEQARSTPVAKG